jgi:putative two-component system response regulator
MSRPRVLIANDSLPTLQMLHFYLASLDCEVLEAIDGIQALALAPSADLLLLDIRMPGLDGYEVCRRLKSAPATRLLPIVIVSALKEVSDRIPALQAGADDFLTLPVDVTELQARVQSMLRLRRIYSQLEDSQNVIFTLARAVEARDAYTEAHTERVAAGALALGRALNLDEGTLNHLHRGALVHDIGKIGIPDAILLKPASLTAAETAIMRTHVLVGESIATPLGTAKAFLSVIRNHHEAYDGSGYPDGLKGEQIPLNARIVAVSDAYDALISDRPYRSRKTTAEAALVLQEGAGHHWDPKLVDLFLETALAATEAVPAFPLTPSPAFALTS